MRKIIIAVGTKRGPKLNALQEALATFSQSLLPDSEFEILGVEVDSGVSHTPTTREELMRGARLRAEALIALARERGESWQYFVGLEGGLDVVVVAASSESTTCSSGFSQDSSRRAFLESWAYVSDGQRGHYGRSGSIEIPEALAHEVLEKGVELAVAIDRFAGAVSIRDAQGAWGVLSCNFVTRQEAFRIALLAAFAPFYNVKMYGSAIASAAASLD